jgi:hypothetical protein
MAVQLSWRITLADDEAAWGWGPDREIVEVRAGRWPNMAVHRGTAVAVGSRRAPESSIADAMVELGSLLLLGGDVVAGAGVDLGGGFR